MFVITGATGHTGSVAAETLLAAGKQVRVVVRDANKAARLESLGAELFVADLSERSALARAVRGAEGVFLISPPDFTPRDFISERKQLTQRQVDVLATEQVPHVVLLSSIGAQHTAGTGPILTLHNAEQQLRSAGVASTFVRAGYFVENWAAVLPAVKGDSVLPTFLKADQRIAMVSTVDIGKTVAQALLDGPRGVRVIELGTPTSADEVAAALTRILGKSVRAVEAPLDAVVPTFVSFGASTNMAELYRGMYEFAARNGFTPAEGEHVLSATPVEDTLRALLSAPR